MTPATIPSSVLVLLKGLGLVGLVIYTLFAAVLVRQEQLMGSVLEEQYQPIIRLLVMCHCLASIILTCLAFVLL